MKIQVEIGDFFEGTKELCYEGGKGTIWEVVEKVNDVADFYKCKLIEGNVDFYKIGETRGFFLNINTIPSQFKYIIDSEKTKLKGMNNTIPPQSVTYITVDKYNKLENRIKELESRLDNFKL